MKEHGYWILEGKDKTGCRCLQCYEDERVRKQKAQEKAESDDVGSGPTRLFKYEIINIGTGPATMCQVLEYNMADRTHSEVEKKKDGSIMVHHYESAGASPHRKDVIPIGYASDYLVNRLIIGNCGLPHRVNLSWRVPASPHGRCVKGCGSGRVGEKSKEIFRELVKVGKHYQSNPYKKYHAEHTDKRARLIRQFRHRYGPSKPQLYQDRLVVGRMVDVEDQI